MESVLLRVRLCDKYDDPVSDATIAIIHQGHLAAGVGTPDIGFVGQTTTDSEGYFQYSFVNEPGVYRIQVMKWRYPLCEFQLEADDFKADDFKGGGIQDVSIDFPHRPLIGRVVDDQGKHVRDAGRVHVFWHEVYVGSTHLDGGNFQFKGLQPYGLYTFKVQIAGRLCEPAPVKFEGHMVEVVV